MLELRQIFKPEKKSEHLVMTADSWQLTVENKKTAIFHLLIDIFALGFRHSALGLPGFENCFNSCRFADFP
jgi:hypothetical protein